VVFHEKYKEVYSTDPASAPGRMEAILNEIAGSYEIITPEPASEEDLLLAHTKEHVDYVKSLPKVYEVAILAVGGAIKAAKIAISGEPAFGLIRPPGHHASRDSSWGFCYFNNIAISILKLRKEELIKRALIIDFDLHFGDGTDNIFFNDPDVYYYHLPGRNREEQLKNLENFLKESLSETYDIIGVSAGFDRHVADWGGILRTEDYFYIGKLIREYSLDICNGRVFAVLEGGYNHSVLGKNVKAFIDGLSE